MLPSPSSSPRIAFSNLTNSHGHSTPTQPRKNWLSLPTPPSDRKGKRQLLATGSREKKRPKLTLDEDESGSSTDDEYVESDEEMMIGAGISRVAARRCSAFGMISAVTNSRTSARSFNPTTRPILQSFVSSHKSDVYKFQSADAHSYLTLPYACAYSNGAKRGATPLLAVATEQGSVDILNTRKRKDWDVEPARTTLTPHTNGIFDVKWNYEDTLIATGSGDHLTCISCTTTSQTLHSLSGHASTVKCIAWDPNHRDLLTTGGRDGSICFWDLRVGDGRMVVDAGNGRVDALSPVMVIPKAQQAGVVATAKLKAPKKKGMPLEKSVTSLLYHREDPHVVVSSGSSDGLLRAWDMRLPPPKKKGSKTPNHISLLSISPLDPTTLHGSRRPRGITSMAAGTGPTAGLIFALGADSRVHTYNLASLSSMTQTEYVHENMQTNSFYTRLSTSPCGRWLASGNTKTGSAFLYDVSRAMRPFDTSPSRGVELRGQLGEVGAVEWADDALATCADDGTVRVWRPDVEVYRACAEDPEEGKWSWSFAVGN